MKCALCSKKSALSAAGTSSLCAAIRPTAGNSNPRPAASNHLATCWVHPPSRVTSPSALLVFPEGHIACKEGKQADWRHLKEKVDAGADFVLTQLFFDNADYLNSAITSRNAWRARAAGARDHPILSTAQSQDSPGFAAPKSHCRCVPGWMSWSATMKPSLEFGIEYATRQCEELLPRGRAGTALLHAEQVALNCSGFEKPWFGVKRSASCLNSQQIPARERSP